MNFWFKFLDIYMNEKEQLVVIAMVSNGKT
jgi:hypothetical protein